MESLERVVAARALANRRRDGERLRSALVNPVREPEEEPIPKTKGTAMKPLGRMDAHGASRQGRNRARNEDNFLIASLRRALNVRQTSLAIEDPSHVIGEYQGHLPLVSDGMGGRPVGDVASSRAIEIAVERLLNDTTWPVDGEAGAATAEQKLAEVFFGVQADLVDDSGADGERGAAPGASLTLACVAWPSLYVAHAGDSRAYLLRDGRLRALTRDHSYARRIEDEVLDGEALPERSKWHSVLWNVVGGSKDTVVPEIRRFELRFGDVLLTCSNGLWRALREEEIVRVLRTQNDAMEASAELVALAGEMGDGDDCTAVVARFLDAAGERQALESPAEGDEMVARTIGGTRRRTRVAPPVVRDPGFAAATA